VNRDEGDERDKDSLLIGLPQLEKATTKNTKTPCGRGKSTKAGLPARGHPFAGGAWDRLRALALLSFVTFVGVLKALFQTERDHRQGVTTTCTVRVALP